MPTARMNEDEVPYRNRTLPRNTFSMILSHSNSNSTVGLGLADRAELTYSKNHPFATISRAFNRKQPTYRSVAYKTWQVGSARHLVNTSQSDLNVCKGRKEKANLTDSEREVSRRRHASASQYTLNGVNGHSSRMSTPVIGELLANVSTPLTVIGPSARRVQKYRNAPTTDSHSSGFYSSDSEYSDCYSSMDYRQHQDQSDATPVLVSPSKASPPSLPPVLPVEDLIENDRFAEIQAMLDSLNNNLRFSDDDGDCNSINGIKIENKLKTTETNPNNKLPNDFDIPVQIETEQKDSVEMVSKNDDEMIKDSCLHIKQQLDVIRMKDFNILQELYRLQDCMKEFKGQNYTAQDHLPPLPKCLKVGPQNFQYS